MPSGVFPQQLSSLEITQNPGINPNDFLNSLKDFLQERNNRNELDDLNLKKLVLESSYFHSCDVFYFRDSLAALLAAAETTGLEVMLIREPDSEDEDDTPSDLSFDYDPIYEEILDSASRKIMWGAGVDRFNHVRSKEVLDIQELRDELGFPFKASSSS